MATDVRSLAGTRLPRSSSPASSSGRAHIACRAIAWGSIDASLANGALRAGRVAERFMAAVTPTRFVVFGSPSDEVKSAAAAFNPEYLAPIGGFAR